MRFIFIWFTFLLFNSNAMAYSIPDWVREARVAGLSIQNGATFSEIQQKVIKLKHEGVSVVELDTSLSKYWTDAQFDSEVAFINTVAEEIHTQGMKVVVYYPAMEVVTEGGETNLRSMAKDHPEWLQRGIDGTPNVFYGSQEDWVSPGSESAWMSPNTGYKDYFINRCNKIVNNTVVDGIWVDVPLYLDTGAPWADANDAAKAAFHEWSAARGDNGGLGHEVPSDVDFNNPVFRIWLRWRHENLAQFIDDVRAAIHAQDSNFVVGIETYPMDYMDTVWTGLDPAFMHRPDNFFRIWEVDSVSNANAMKYSSIEDFSSKIAMYKWGRGIDRDMPSWAFSYAFEGKDAGLTIAATVATKNSPFESKTPVMTQTADAQTRKRWYDFIHENNEALLKTDRLARAGIWFSSPTREYQDMPAGGLYGMYLEENPPQEDPDWWAQIETASFRTAPHLSGTRGAAHALIQLGMPYKVVQTPTPDQSQINGLSILWLPSVGALSDADAILLRQFVQNGGTLFATGNILPGSLDELGNPRLQSVLDDVFGFDGSTTPARRMHEFGKGVAIFRPDLKGVDLFAGQGGNSGLAERTLGEIEQIIKLHTHEDLIVDLPQGVFVDISEVQNNQQHLYVVNYSGLKQPLVTNLLNLPIEYRAPQGYRVTSATIKSPDLHGTTMGNLPVTQVAQGIYKTTFTIDQFALVTYNLEAIETQAPSSQMVTLTIPGREEVVTSGFNFIMNKMRHSNAPDPISYGIRTNLIDNNSDTDVYTGGWHMTTEHMGLFLRVASLMGEAQAFDEGYQFVRDVLYSKGYHVLGWSVHKEKHKRFLQADNIDDLDVQAAANAPLDDLRAIHGLLDGAYLTPEAESLGHAAGEGLLLTTVTDLKRGIAPKFPNYAGGILGISFDWADHDDITLTPTAVGSGVSRLSITPIPVDYQDLETMAMLAHKDTRWIPVIASAVDMMLDSEIPTAPGFFYNSLDQNGNFSGDFEYLGERRGMNLKVIQELWTILHLKRISKVAPWILDSTRRSAAAAASQRGYDAFKNFYLTHAKRIPEYLTFEGADVPDGNTSNHLLRGTENLFDGEARIYAQLARLALLFEDNAFAAQVINDKIVPDRVTDPINPRFGMIGLSTAGDSDAEAWNTLESLLTILLEARVSNTGNPNNQAPVANSDTLIAGKDTIRRIYPVELLGNDTDANDDILSIHTVDTTTSAGGTISQSQGDYLYTPPIGFEGEDSFNYVITDGFLSSTSVRVNIDVKEGAGGPTTIIVDGDLADWPTTQTIIYTDPKEIIGANNLLDIRQMHLTNDENKVYIAYTTERKVAFNEGFTLFIDADRNPSTGYKMWNIGADFILQGPSLFKYVGESGKSQWLWNYVGDGAVGVNDTLIEFSFDRNWINNPGSFDFIFYGDNEAYGGDLDAVDYLPDDIDSNRTDQATFLTYELKGENPNNNPPVAYEDQLKGVQDTVRIIAPAELLANDTDPNFDTLHITEIESTSKEGGTITQYGAHYRYTPALGYTGEDSFAYSVSDGTHTATSQVTIHVSTSAQSMVIDGALDDWPASSYVISDPADINITHKSLDILEMRLHKDTTHLYISYIMKQAVTFDKSFTLYLDVDQQADTGFKVWNIGSDLMMQGSKLYRYAGTGTNWQWEELADINTGIQGSLIELSVSRQLLGNPDQIHFLFHGDTKTYNGTPDAIDYLPDNVDSSQANKPTFLKYSFVDSNPSNSAPSATADLFQTTKETPLVISSTQLLSNDTDPETDRLSILSVDEQSTQQGTIILNGTDYLYTPASGFVGKDSFYYSISDGNLSSSAEVIITVDTGDTNGSGVSTSESSSGGGALGLLLPLIGLIGTLYRRKEHR